MSPCSSTICRKKMLKPKCHHWSMKLRTIAHHLATFGVACNTSTGHFGYLRCAVFLHKPGRAEPSGVGSYSYWFFQGTVVFDFTNVKRIFFSSHVALQGQWTLEGGSSSSGGAEERTSRRGRRYCRPGRKKGGWASRVGVGRRRGAAASQGHKTPVVLTACGWWPLRRMTT